MKKLLPWLILAIALWLIVRDPGGAAAGVRHFFHALSAFASAL